MRNLAEARPYSNTWTIDKKKTIRYAPDCLVYINGDTSLPGCTECGGLIDVQEFITQVSVDLGTDPSSCSCSISMTVPEHHIHTFVKAGECLIIPGLEIHIYMKGFFPVDGIYDGPQEGFEDGEDLRGFPHTPLYHTFHGVSISSQVSYSGGFQTISISGSGMLHFWQYHQISTSASQFGARPQGSNLKTTLMGHTFNGQTPYAIAYTLFHDTAGAAGGVGFALSAKDNQKAKSTVTNQSLFSMNIDYWQQRFSTRMFSLRMHGASGELFNSAQASFLARLSSGNLERIVKEAIFLGKKTNADKAKKSDIFSTALQLGIISETRDQSTGEVRYTTGLTFTDTQSVSENGVTEQFNLGSIQAYVQGISQYGEVNFWESTYESKMDMIQQLCDKTGFEFYQDADGDMVFKPPLYNLDTSGSRIYRLEDEDLIDISFSIKEPEATYVTMKGSQFKNLKDTGTDGEFGTRGQYIDYKLVAQFGWREGSLETEYFSNPRSMFYACVNRLDILNAQTYSASATIPLRPEIRAGYPVYIPYLDSYYYVTNISHSFSFGGGCTSSLELVARRKPFLPPSVPGKTGIEAVSLENTYFPKKGLQVIDNEGRPRVVGLPNTVLALDPEAINPLFFSVGSDLTDISNPIVVRNLVEMAKQYGILEVEPGGSYQDGPFLLTISENENAELDPNGFALKNSNVVRDESTRLASKTLRFTFKNLTDSAQQYSKLQNTQLITANAESTEQAYLEGIRELTDVIIPNLQLDIVSLQEDFSLIPEEDTEARQTITDRIKQAESQIEDANARIKDLNTNLTDLATQKSQELGVEGAVDEASALMIRDLIDQVTDVFKNKSGGNPTTSKTASYLDLLSDKKASFSSNSVPGHYRYFSCSHPNPKYQGMQDIKASSVTGPAGGGNIPNLSQSKTVTGFLSYPTKVDASGNLPEAELGPVEVRHGLRVLTGSKTDTILSTDDIQTLSFSKHIVKKESGETFYRYGQIFSGVNKEYEDYVIKIFEATDSNGNFNSTIVALYGPTWNRLVLKPPKTSASGAEIIIDSVALSFPSQLTLGTTTVNTSTAILDLQKQFYSLETSLNAFKSTTRLIIRALASDLIVKVSNYLDRKWKELEEAFPASIENSSPQRVTAEQNFSELVGYLTNAYVKFNVGSNVKLDIEKDLVFYTPIFPVSDEKGYEVYGTYKYGRGLDIIGESSLQAVNFADPFQFADPKTVEAYTKTLRGETTKDITTPDGQVNEVPKVERALSKAETDLIASIRSNPETPSSIISYLDNTTQTGVGLSNWMKSAKEFTGKIVASNVPVNLSQLRPLTNLNTCDCKMHDSYVALESLSTEGFVEILPPDVDTITQTLATEIDIKGEMWSENKKILSGEKLLPS